MLKRIVYFLIFFFPIVLNSSAQGLFKIKGTVKEKENNEVIVGATITWSNGNKGVVTGSDGEFEITSETYINKLEVQALGKRSRTVKLDSTKTHFLEIFLENYATELSEVVVSSTKKSTVQSASMGVDRIGIESLRKMPPTMGEVDVINSLKMLPGVTSVGEGSGGINVRGGSIDQNLVLFDGAPILLTGHLFGFFSIFNQDVVGEVNLYKNSIPAKYGGRVSSVVEINSIDDIPDSISFKGGIGLISSRFSINTPLKTEKFGLLVSGRSTYSNWLLKTASNDRIKNSSAFFYDINAKLSYHDKTNSKLDISFYDGSDKFSFSKDTLYSYGNTSVSFNYLQRIKKDFSFKYLLAYSNNWSQIDGFYGNQDFNFSLYNQNLLTRLFVIKDFTNYSLDMGVEGNYYNINPGELTPSTSESIVDKVSLENQYGVDYAIFIDGRFDFGRFKADVGLRFSSYYRLGSSADFIYQDNQAKSVNSVIDTVLYQRNESTINYNGLEPRLSFAYNISKRQSIKIGYQRTRQYLQLISNNAAIAPSDIYKLSDLHFKPQISDQFSIGYFKEFSYQKIYTSLEAFYKLNENVIDYKDGALLTLNEQLETEVVNTNGIAFGGELSIEKQLGKLSGRFAYTFTRTLYRSETNFAADEINDGEMYPAPFDKPHNLSVNALYEISPSLSLTANFSYSTGRPVTLPVSKFDLDDITVSEISKRNQFRVPDYHRMDVALIIKPKKQENFESKWTIGVYNLYGRKNPFSVFYQDKYGAPPQAYKLAILGIPFPSITYDFKF